MKLTLALLLITSPAAGETFAERWPSPVTVDPAPVSAPEPPRAHAARPACRDLVHPEPQPPRLRPGPGSVLSTERPVTGKSFPENSRRVDVDRSPSQPTEGRAKRQPIWA